MILFIALYKRREITRICFEAIKALKTKVDVFCVCSCDEDVDLCQEYGFDYCVTENRPLGRKMNFGLKFLRNKRFEYMMQLGSDDIITDDIFELYRECFERKELYFGIKDYYMADMERELCKYWVNDVNHPIGAGRVIHRDVLREMNYQLWPEQINKGLDTHSDINLKKHGFNCKIIDTKKFPYVIDLKSDENIHSYDSIQGEDVDYNYTMSYAGAV